MYRFLGLIALCSTGCAMPGMSASVSFTLPPTLLGSNTVAAMPTQSMPSFVIEQPGPQPVITRQYSTLTAPVPAQAAQGSPYVPAMPPAPPVRPEMIPPPSGCGRPCN